MSPVRRGEALPIHNRIAVLRAERRMSRVQLAGEVEVNPQTIGALERGDHFPSLDLAFRICGVFGLPVEAVFSREEFSPLPARHWSPEPARHWSPEPVRHQSHEPGPTGHEQGGGTAP